jgi:hypothetical protein
VNKANFYQLSNSEWLEMETYENPEYQVFQRLQTKRIHLFGDCTPEKKLVIYSTLLSFDVIATFEGLEVNHDS